MQGPENIEKMFSEIDDLRTIVQYGKARMDDFAGQMDRLETSLRQEANTLDRQQVTETVTTCRCLQGSVQATANSLSSWKRKAETYLQILHQLARDRAVQAATVPLDLQKIKDNITELLSIIRHQLQRVGQQQQRLKQLLLAWDGRKQALVSFIERGRTPQLEPEEALYKDHLAESA